MSARIVVIGGGVSGLAAAHRVTELDPSAEVTVLEASERTGGLLRSERTDDGYVIERGPDSILTTKPAALELARRLGIEDRIVRTNGKNRGAYVCTRGELVRIPQGFNVVAPSALVSLWASPVLSWPGKARAALDLLLPRGEAGPDESLAHFVRRRFGPELLERLAQPMAGGIYGAKPHRLSLRATMPRFLDLESSDRSVTLGLMRRAKAAGADAQASGARYGLFISFDQGVEVLPEALAAALGERVRRQTPAKGLERVDGRWRVPLEDGHLDADGVVLAVPARRVAALVGDLAPEARAHLAAIPYGSAATATFAWDEADIPFPLDASGFVVPAIEGRMILASTWASAKWPGRAPAGKQLIRVFLGGNDRDEIVGYTDQELIREARRGMDELMGIRAEPLLTRVDRYVGNMPRYEVGHLQRMDRVDAALAAYPSLALAGSFYRGVGIPDSIASGERAGAKVLAAAA